MNKLLTKLRHDYSLADHCKMTDIKPRYWLQIAFYRLIKRGSLREVK